MLRSERLRTEELAAREAAGESLWTPIMSEPVRVKLQYVVADAGFHSKLLGDAANLVYRARGIRYLTGPGRYPQSDLIQALEESPEEVVKDVLEALVVCLCGGDFDPSNVEYLAANFLGAVNEVLYSNRISFEFVGPRIVDFESREMHRAVVVPTLQLLGGDARFALAETAYQNAIREQATADGAADAITDAGTCLQEALSALGCRGNSLGPLLKDAKAKGLLGPSDSKIESGIGNLIDWVSTDRSTNGDAHNAKEALREDAWLAIHVVGALVLRLAAGTPRG